MSIAYIPIYAHCWFHELRVASFHLQAFTFLLKKTQAWLCNTIWPSVSNSTLDIKPIQYVSWPCTVSNSRLKDPLNISRCWGQDYNSPAGRKAHHSTDYTYSHWLINTLIYGDCITLYSTSHLLFYSWFYFCFLFEYLCRHVLRVKSVLFATWF